ncbi:hypothetical protein ACFFTN_01450 [Aminobacter aganoensis]|uniref:Uncharacterized protein n=1 Tax=Aminobacter aganoensis TaxID=83264 RepID=A0A7X0KJX2_9HYPH|nr:hypothetical protein [Aminobacter aganoensis]MBB6353475.1 hypothetical protein [Aminobacter aganoensis]
MKQIRIDDATATQLAQFATVSLGLDIDYRKGSAAIKAAMAAVGYDKDHIEVADDQAPKAQTAKPQADGGAPAKMIKIMIPNQDIPGSTAGKEAVPVGVNGKVYLIKRGIAVDVPSEVVEVLKNANKVQYDKGPNNEPINPTLVPTHPFSILG